jgi:hypothetical protein
MLRQLRESTEPKKLKNQPVLPSCRVLCRILQIESAPTSSQQTQWLKSLSWQCGGNFMIVFRLKSRILHLSRSSKETLTSWHLPNFSTTQTRQDSKKDCLCTWRLIYSTNPSSQISHWHSSLDSSFLTALAADFWPGRQFRHAKNSTKILM